jgi:homospermidine synthase
MADDESLSSHWVQSPAQVTGLEPQPDFGCRLLTVDHGRAHAPAGALHTVLLYGHARNAYRFGSRLSVEETRKLAPYQSATGLQVTSAVLADMVWAAENADAGIVEADEIDFARCLQVQRPCLGPVEGHFTTWTPLTGRSPLFPQDIDPDDPWQFRNVLVH